MFNFLIQRIQNIKLIIVIALLLRMAIFFAIIGKSNFMSNDSYQYKESALTIIDYGSFSHSIKNLDIPELIRTPGYPFFIAIIYKIFGREDINLIILNIALSLASLILINKILSCISNKKAASIGSL